VTEQLDEEKLARLRSWAEGLLDNEQAELRAAARGLLLLADEIERLWRSNRSSFGDEIGSALAERLGRGSGTDAEG
jgi:hypothetical protein